MSLSSSLFSVGRKLGFVFFSTSDFIMRNKKSAILLFDSEDRLPPAVVVNKGLVLDENSVKKITTLQLSSTDQDSEPGELIYHVTKQTQLGHLELSTNPGTLTPTCIIYIVGGQYKTEQIILWHSKDK